MTPDAVLQVGDAVMWRGNFGTSVPAVARVVALEVTAEPREKYGEPASSAPWALVFANRVVVTLDNGTWAYGEQLRPAAVTP